MDYVTRSGMTVEASKSQNRADALKRYHQEIVTKKVSRDKKEKPER